MIVLRAISLLFISLIFSGIHLLRAQEAKYWSDKFGPYGLNGGVSSVEFDKDSTMYVGGSFTVPGKPDL
ncbi:MAG: hypothetical protein ABEH43_08850, partial [Flavobacteriales bacterium]